MIKKTNIDVFLKKCMQHYPDSLIMKYANEKAQNEMMSFMIREFLPEWKKEVLGYMNDHSLYEIDDKIILEDIHSRLYLKEGYSEKESELFKNSDPAGHDRFVKQGIQQAMNEAPP